MFSAEFLLREQLIGEQRGLKRARDIVLELYNKLKESESPDHENTETSSNA